MDLILKNRSFESIQLFNEIAIQIIIHHHIWLTLINKNNNNHNKYQNNKTSSYLVEGIVPRNVFTNHLYVLY